MALYDPERDRDLAYRFAQDIGVSALVYLSLVQWVLGESDRSHTTMTEALAHAAKVNHVPTLVYANLHAAWLEMIRLDPGRCKPPAETALAAAREHGMKMWMLLAPQMVAWSNACSTHESADCEQMRRSIADANAQNLFWGEHVGLPLLAECEAAAGQLNSALATIEQSIAETQRTSVRFFEAESYRIRGKILLKRDPANTAVAEEAFQTAMAIAREQEARSFELRAALALAKLYQSTGRAADAHAVLAPAVEGFSPTPEFPEIEEAHALLDTLTRSDEIKAVSAARQQRAKLHVALGNALIAARGYGAPETTAAFARASEAAALDKNAPEHFSALYGLWSGGHMRGELAAMREHAAAFLRDVERRPHSPEAGVAHRINGITSWFAGEFAEARGHYEKALAIFDPARDADLAYRFGQDAGVGALAYRALALWPLGEVDSAVRSMEAAKARASELTHAGTIAYCKMHAAMFEMMRGDFARAAPLATALAELAREHDLKFWGACAAFVEGWTATRDDLTAGRAQMRHGLDLLNIVAFEGLFKGAFAVAEARAGDYPAALATLDHAASVIERTGERWFDAELHRTRGEILVKQNPADPAPAEAVFLTAIAVAREQKARSFELLAALSLGKLYQSTGRAADAHAVLAPALEGFSPTPEFPEIEETQALLDTLS